MKSFISSAAVQGMAAEQGTSVPFSTKFNSFFSFSEGRFLSAKLLFLLSLLLGFSAAVTKGQNSDTLLIQDAGFYVYGPASSLSSGESAELDIHIGLATDPIASVAEIELEIELETFADMPDLADISFTDSWFYDGSATVELQSGSHSIRITGTRNPSVNGGGLVLKVNLTANQDGVDPQSMVKTGVGIMDIDDMGFKTKSLASSIGNLSDPILYPNPCRDFVNFEWNGPQASLVNFYNSQGQLVGSMDEQALQLGRFDCSHFPPGRYLVVMSFSDRNPIRHHLLKR